jgi:hypothetical protein
MGDITALFTYINPGQHNQKRKCVETASIRKQGQKSQATTGRIAGNEGGWVRCITNNNYAALWIMKNEIIYRK